MVHAEAFLAEEGMFECVNMRDVDLLAGLELVESMGGIRSQLKEAA